MNVHKKVKQTQHKNRYRDISRCTEQTLEKEKHKIYCNEKKISAYIDRQDTLPQISVLRF